jgi:hypothetical protein
MNSTLTRVVHWTTVLLLTCILLSVAAVVLYFVVDVAPQCMVCPPSTFSAWPVR